MKVFGWLRARPRALASGGIVTVAAVALTTMAFLYQGMPTAKVDLNDGGVWVTKTSAMLVGHFNDQSKLLDGGVRAASRNIDVLQSGNTVVVVDDSASTATVVDPAMVTLGGSGHLPAGAKVVLGGSTVAVLNDGELRIVPASTMASFDAAKVKPVVDLGPGADVAVGTDGTVHAVSAKTREIVDIPTDPQGQPGQPARHGLGDLGDKAKPTITAVGATAVVLDATSGTVLTEDGLKATIDRPDGAVLQQPSPDADGVVIATSDALLRVPFDGSAVQKKSAGGTGTAAAPVQLAGCSYGVWSGSARFVRECPGAGDDLVKAVPGATSSAKLLFRTNRDVVVLNDVAGGTAWAVSGKLQRVDNWDDVTPPEGKDQQTDDQTDQTVQTSLPKRSEINHPPTANPDDYGVRPGRTTILPVLENDTDPDGDVLTASAPPTTRLGTIQRIQDGGALQITVPADATGGDSFKYTADDGRGGTSQATVTLTVHPWSENSAPVQSRQTTLTMETGGTLSYNVLPDWKDPDGDEMMLLGVEAPKGDEVQFTPDGTITYRAVSGALGPRDLTLHVSDGSKVGTGVLHVNVLTAGSTSPVANADHIVVRAGDTATVSPLANDYTTGVEPLRLTRIDNVPGLTLTPDYNAGTFTVRSDIVGTYYVQYLVAAGSPTAAGVVRVDVIDSAQSDLPPVAVRDIALVHAGGETLVNVLANDSDPSGGILVVQSVQVPAGSGVTAAVLNHDTVRIGDQGMAAGQVIVSYTISNGRKSANGSIVVIPLPAPSVLRPPVARDDTAVVRAGDVVTIPVLENDTDPDGGTLHVVPQLVAPLPDPKSGEIFVAQDTVRFRASDTPGTVHATYEVVNDSGQKDAAYITIQVVPVNKETNQAPQPKELVARVLAGTTVHIQVPLDGIDPDGDSVTLEGIASAPSQGRVVSVGPAEIVYQAFDTAFGGDSFTYRVRDRLGAEATATIRVGIAPSPTVNQAPYAVKDAVTVRPGRTISVPVLANDSDPNGDQIGLVANGLILPQNADFTAKVVGSRVEVTAPNHPEQTSLQYTIRNAHGAQAIGVVQITVKADVPLVPPIARDDYVGAADVKNGGADIDVLANDEDPDGTVSDLKLTFDDPGVRVVSGGKVHVTLTDADQLIMYTVTDPDGLTGSAFIHVPGKNSLPPSLVSTSAVEVKSGQSIELPLAQYVRSASGGRVILTEAAKVSAVHSNGGSLAKDATTLVYTSAPGYFGPDALTFEVTDGTGPDDPNGHKATLTIPITVLPPDNQPPTFINGQLSVAPGETASSLDLRGLTSDPDKGDLAKVTYQIEGGTPQGVSASIDGGTLKVSAEASTPKGTVATLRIRLTDGVTTPVEGTVTVTVAASTRPLATANDDVVDQAHQGTTVSVSVLDNDFNPFPDKPLKLLAAAVATGSGTATVNGSKVDVAIAKDYVGQMVVRYRVQDATGDPDREVEGRILLTVQGRPGQPGVPTVTSVQDRTVVLNWTPPVDNGAPITGYTVQSVAGGYSKQCASTTCTLDGLTNNVEYNFTVTATNSVGTSDPSLPSQTARPDARPDTPQAPTTVFGDKSIKVSWATPSTPGSPVQSYNLQISPAPPSGVAEQEGVTGNSITWSGLENGTAYQVRVQARNLAPDPSSWSDYSLSTIPAAPPAAPAQPTTQRLQPLGTQSQIEVDWAAPANNGDAIANYQLDVMQGTNVVNSLTVAGTSTSQAINLPNSTTDYTFRVRASNKAGPGAWSPTSAPRRAFATPGTPGTPTATDGNNQVTVSFAAADGNGATASEVKYQYSVNGGAWLGDWVSGGSGTGATITGVIGNGHVNNNGTYKISVRAYTTLDGVTYSGNGSAQSNAAQPYGPIGNPTATAGANGTSITFSWSSPARNGRDITTQVLIDGAAASSNASGSITRSYPYSQTHTITVHTTAAGQTTTASASARTVDPPPPPQPDSWASRGPSVYTSDCSTSGCAYVVFNVKNWVAGNYTLNCHDNTGSWSYNTYYVPANGSVQLYCYTGYTGSPVWVGYSGPGGSGNSRSVIW
ncbi:Ig-like domain-containing protein [Microbacterium sp. ASV49]|uniref:Ig-like domain-containing protein n=1 Tax=Microbacterium candidum TaxID=3041922 RepID=A0ABT7MUS1_9MICO|nr:Ig-like domain-containing protein [Microbacterium sp. ASV49]MDL9978197.1 Ig-like domain-containing protein [Microbacterium sp. ASV49]